MTAATGVIRTRRPGSGREDRLDEDLWAPAGGSVHKRDGQRPVAAPSNHRAGRLWRKSFRRPLPDHPSVTEAGDRRDHRAGLVWLAAGFRSSASLQTSGVSWPDAANRTTDEVPQPFLAAMPLSVNFALADEASGKGLAMLSSGQLLLGATTIASTAISVGYVIWLIRCGSPVASMLASLPTWCSFDPLPILTSRPERGRRRRRTLGRHYRLK